MTNIGIIGSTGSIGTQAIEVLKQLGDFQVVSLSCDKNIELVEKQARILKPKIIHVNNPEKAKDLQVLTKDLDIKIVSGQEGLIEASTYEGLDIILMSIVGMNGIKPTMAAIEKGIDIAHANKETLVCAGDIITSAAKENNVNIYPVDSEHSAIFQCLRGQRKEEIKRIILTASGGPFRGYTIDELSNVTLEDALNHPTWTMGKKVTIDSSTLVNKGLEVIEARWLFDIEPENIDVIVHPQSIIHSMVELVDGAILAQLGSPDMKLPIQYAINYPNRARNISKRLDIDNISNLTFEKPDMDTFKGLHLAYDSINTGGTMPAVFNIANEIAVKLFLNNKINYLDITSIINECMNEHKVINDYSINDIFDIKYNLYDKYKIKED